MILVLTMLFLMFWYPELIIRLDGGEEHFWFVLEGATIILCGLYWGIWELREMTDDFTDWSD